MRIMPCGRVHPASLPETICWSMAPAPRCVDSRPIHRAKLPRLSVAAASMRARVSTPSQAVVLRQHAAKRVDVPSRGMADKAGGSGPSTTTTTKTGTPPPAGEPALEAPAAAAAAAASAEVPPKTKSNNLLIGTVLIGIAGASYYMTIHKMKDQDFLGDVEKEAEEEAQVNLHKSGLKVSSKVVPEKPAAAGTAAVTDAAEKVVDELDAIAEEAEKEFVRVAEAAKAQAEAQAEAAPAVSGDEEPKKKKKGWRKYIFFGPRRGGD